jgi:asparagine synthase (glutamine-hydrolysing)
MNNLTDRVFTSKEEFLDAIPETIKQIESYCTTTVRASVGNYFVSKFIAKETNDKVIFCGDVADELFGSYRGFINAKTDKSFLNENKKLMEDIHFFDVLRSDKSISGAGLEARVPFADKDFMKYVMAIINDIINRFFIISVCCFLL